MVANIMIIMDKISNLQLVADSSIEPLLFERMNGRTVDQTKLSYYFFSHIV